MAGIGLELRRIYSKKKLFSEQKMYLYAGLYYGGPMLLGVGIVVFISVLSYFAGLDRADRSLLTSIFTYSIILSLLFSNTFSMVIGRYVSDMIYVNRIEKLIPTFFSSNLIMVLLGEVLYICILLFSELGLANMFLSLLLFAELLVLWNTVNFIMSIKKYKMVLFAYLTAIAVVVVLGVLLYFFGVHNITSLLFTICIGYGIILFTLIRIIFRTLPIPKERISSFEFLTWFDKFPNLIWMGFALYLGAFLHVVAIWFGPIGERVKTVYFHAPYYDVPAFYAFLTTIITTVNFSIFIEVEFYEKFKKLYWLYNNQGNVHEIQEAKYDMLLVLRRELKYLAWKQMFATMIFTFIGTYVLQILPLGFTNLMLGYFRILCIAYGVFAISQSMLLVLLYFDDVEGATKCSIVYALLNILAVIVNQFIPVTFYGFGFLLANIIFFMHGVFRLETVTKKLSYFVLARQPMMDVERRGIFAKLRETIEKGGLDEEIQNKHTM